MNFKKNLFDLISDAHRFQYIEINDAGEGNKQKKPMFFFTTAQWIIMLLSTVAAVYLKSGVSDNFAGYIISGLSLFVGLFFTFIITLYSKFDSIDFTIYQKQLGEDKYIAGVRLKNFFKKISVLALYSVLISIIAILLLSLTLLFPKVFNFSFDFVGFLKMIKTHKLCITIQVFAILLYRISVLYFLLDFVLIAIYIISAFYDFIISEFNRKKLS